MDAKGRVSVPAQFRAALKEQRGLYCFRAILLPAVECWRPEELTALSEQVHGLPTFSEEQNDYQAILNDAELVTWDETGRIVLPKRLAEYAQITDEALFAGGGRSFRIWSPDAFERHDAEQRAQLASRRGGLPGSTPASGGK
jgi:MraZ protein